MKKLLLIILTTQALFVQANNHVLQQLSSVNILWQNQTDIAPVLAQTSIAPNINHIDLIALHLQLVEQILRNRNVETLSSTQKENRAQLLNKLNTYWHAKQFPVNDYLTYKSPVFIDRFGTHCAVGYLMQQSGNEQLAREIDSKQKFAFVHDIKVESVKTWANEFGFTIDELAWIQPGYWVTNTAFDLDGGVNGQLNAILIEQAGSTIYAAGEFNTAGGTLPANNIAVYQSGFAGWFWMSLGNGVNGKIKTMILHNNQIIVGGEFTQADGIAANHVALYDLVSGQWQSMGSIDSTVNTLAVYNNEIYAGGSFTTLLAKWDGNAWQDMNQIGFYGNEVRTLEVINNELIIGGDFELPTGALRKNVVGYDGSQFIYMGFGTLTPVNDLALYNGRIYAACDVVSGNDTCALALFNGVDWEKVIYPVNTLGNYFLGQKINALAVNGNQMICGGNFTCGSFLFFGKNMLRFEQNSTAAANDYVLTPLLYLDSTVNVIALLSSYAYFGGDFTNNNITNTLNHVAYFDVLTGLKSNNKEISNELTIYPNPAKELFTINSNQQFNTNDFVKITDCLGREVLQFQLTFKASKYEFDVSKFSEGIYNVNFYVSGIVYHQKLVVSH